MENEFKIEAVITPLQPPRETLIAWASIIINNSFLITGIGIHLAKEEIRITFPAKKLASSREKYLYFFKPLNQKIASQILEVIKREVEKSGLFKP